jgi:hypothetical protein
LGLEDAEEGAGAMLLAYRLASLSALETQYAGFVALTQTERGYSATSGLTQIAFALRDAGTVRFCCVARDREVGAYVGLRASGV